MKKVQTYILKVNTKNGTVVIPKKARVALGISDTVILSVIDNKPELKIPKYSVEDVLYNLKPTSSVKQFTDQELQDAIKETSEESATNRYLKAK